MSEYVAFKCSLCSMEAATLENLESHIWNRHLGTFQYHCGECSYPALNCQALVSHYHSQHQSCQDVQFKRKIADEMKLRNIIAASIVVPLYEEDEQIYDESNQVPQVQVIETVSNEGEVLQEAIPLEEMEVVHQQQQMIEEVDQNGDLIYMPKDYQEEYLDENGREIIEGRSGEVVALSDENGDLVDCEPSEGSYPIYSGHDLLDDGYQYVDEEGNTVYVTDQYPYPGQKSDEMELRATKHRHINMIVEEMGGASGSGMSKKKRATTVWQCPECGKTVRYPSRIEEHRRMHAGNKPFPCEICGQKFAQKGALKCHMRSHSGDRPYACSWDCGKTFVSASAQRMHEKHHIGEKPFVCNICGKLFGKKSHLLRHEQSVHLDPPLEVLHGIPLGLESAGTSMEILKEIVDGIVEDVQKDKHLRSLSKKEVRLLPSIHL